MSSAAAPDSPPHAELEANFDGLVGPTHNYGGLSPGNLASIRHHGRLSNPRAAAREGLAKMRYLAALGVPQAVLPPHERPHLPTLRRLGFSGNDSEVLSAVARHAEHLLRLTSSASAMWTANAATVCPARDSSDGRLHITIANLSYMFHRSVEAATNHRILSRIFADGTRFAVHEPLPSTQHFADEGAANHSRLCDERGGVQLFAWGRHGFTDPDTPGSDLTRHPARQTREASLGVARQNRVKNAVFWRQDPRGIDSGSFHSDVLAVGHRQLFVLHEFAFVRSAELLETLSRQLGAPIRSVVASEAELPVQDAVASYPFNSQIVTAADGRLHLIAPSEAGDNVRARRFLESLIERGSIARVHYLNVNASMNNGGGPACLRLRVALQPDDMARINGKVWLDDELYRELSRFVDRHYRDRLQPKDLSDPQLLLEVRTALDELSSLLGLGNIYEFQR